jgi:hypothetical protein
MGFDYIHSRAKSHTKAWSDQFIRAADDLFASSHAPIERTFVARSIGRATLREGDPVHVRRSDNSIVVCQGIAPLASAETPSLALLESVDAAHGILDGVVTEVIDAAQLILVRVKEGTSSD